MSGPYDPDHVVAGFRDFVVCRTGRLPEVLELVRLGEGQYAVRAHLLVPEGFDRPTFQHLVEKFLPPGYVADLTWEAPPAEGGSLRAS